MVRYYCDVCDEEVGKANYVSNRFKDHMVMQKDGRQIEVGAEILVSTNGVWNQGAICGKCLGEFLRFWFPIPATPSPDGEREE